MWTWRENESDISMTNDDYEPDASSETTTSEQTETRCYPERTRQPPDCQDNRL